MEEKPLNISLRTRQFALRIVKLFVALPKSGVAPILGKQLVRAGTSVGAHMAEAGHSKSAADFICKCQGARQEMEETIYWLTLLSDAAIVKSNRLDPLIDEGHEIIAILVTMTNKAKRRL
jgi:four helix bundle protein